MRSSRYRLLRIPRERGRLIAVVALGILVVLILAGMSSLLSSQPGELAASRAVSDSDIPQDNLIYDRSGQVLLADTHFGGARRYHTSLGQEGKWLPSATVAIEDANFWHEGGIDPAAILRAALADLSRHRIVQGGSTIVQQLVKQRVTGDSETLFRKLREAVIATQINGTTSKQQILEMYLNTVFYGNNAYGGQAAAQTFFHIDANQLDLAQASMLAGLPQNPNADNPLLHWDAARHRQRQVLDAMVRNNSITAKQSDQAYAEDLRAPQHMFGDQPSSLAPAFTDWINQQ
ncbi:MAG: transglycosylase domain-containing protein, partial [Candidatus Dormibacteraceae bacterium]